MRVLVAGGTEFLSPHLVRALLHDVAQTYEWYRKEGLDRRAVDFGTEDALLALLRS